MSEVLKREPLLSVIVVVYNTEKYVRRCLSSIMQQTYKELEVIVVNNGSNGNIEEIVQEYCRYYPSHRIILTRLPKNVGLFHARVHGAQIAAGRYVAFVDSDDSISVDYYRPMVSRAESNGCEIVANDFVDEYEDSGVCMRYNLETLSHTDISLSGHAVLEHFLEHEGLIFGWVVVWNKIYRRSLWERALVDIKQFKHRQVINEDVIFSTVLFYHASSFSNVHSGEYYYFRRNSAHSSNQKPLAALKKDMDDLGASFKYLDSFLRDRVNCEQCTYLYNQLKARYMRLWIGSIESTSLSKREKAAGLSYLQQVMHDNQASLPDKKDHFFYSKYTAFPPWEEQLRTSVADAQYKRVSFSALNVLVSWPFLSKDDFYDWVGKNLEKEFPLLSSTTFSIIRAECQQAAERELNGVHAIALKDVYDRFKRYGINETQSEKMMVLECELFVSVSQPRNSGKSVLDLAKAAGKIIYIIEDSVYPSAVWEQIFIKCGIYGYSYLYVSSEMGATKYDGGLFRYISYPKGEHFFHVGTDYVSDVVQCTKQEGSAQIFPAAYQLMYHENPSICSGHAMVRTYGFRYECMQYSFLQRRLWAIQSHLCFDKALLNYNPESDYDANPYCLGVMVFAPIVIAYFNSVKRTISSDSLLCLSADIPQKSILGKLIAQEFSSSLSPKGIYQLCVDSNTAGDDKHIQFAFFKTISPRIPTEGRVLLRKILLWEESANSYFAEKYILRGIYQGISTVLTHIADITGLDSDGELYAPERMLFDFLVFGSPFDLDVLSFEIQGEPLLRNVVRDWESIYMLNTLPEHWGSLKRCVYYALYDRKSLKDKVKKRLQGSPFLLHIMSFGYRLLRTIWHSAYHIY